MSTSGPALMPELCFVGVDVADGEEALRLLASASVEHGFAHKSIIEAVVLREQKFPTGLPLPTPVAIPHADAEHTIRPAMAALVPTHPLTFGELGGQDRKVEVELVLMLMVTDPKEQVGLLGRLIKVLRAPDLGSTLLGDLETPDQLASRFAQLLAQSE
jgi:PTS system galactitol-specific IIA component